MVDELIISGLIIFIVFAVGTIIASFLCGRCNRKQMDYYTFFLMGSVLWIAGLIFITMHPVFLSIAGLGLIYIGISLANTDKWKGNPNARKKKKAVKRRK